MTEEEHMSAIRDATIHFLNAHEKHQTYMLAAPRKWVNPYEILRDDRQRFLSKCMVEASNAGFKPQAYQQHKATRNDYYAARMQDEPIREAKEQLAKRGIVA